MSKKKNAQKTHEINEKRACNDIFYNNGSGISSRIFAHSRAFLDLINALYAVYGFHILETVRLFALTHLSNYIISNLLLYLQTQFWP
jgi:hypothetical protein